MEHVHCNLCGVDDAETLFRIKDKFGVADEPFRIVQCRRCNLVFISPRPSPEEMGKYYPETYSWKESFGGESLLTGWVRKAERVYRYHLLRHEVSSVIEVTGKNTGKVLDVGCGTGDRLNVFQSHGFQSCGVETADSADYAAKVLKLDVRKGDLFAARFPDQSFDVVTLYHVLEHTHAPLGVCREIRRILKKDGRLVIQVPNMESWQYRVFGPRWAGFDIPRHLYTFGKRTIVQLLETAGFQVTKVDHIMNWWHPPTLVLTLFPGLDPQKSWEKEGRGKNTLLRRIAWIFCTLAVPPLTYSESLMKRGAIITCYAVKRVQDN